VSLQDPFFLSQNTFFGSRVREKLFRSSRLCDSKALEATTESETISMHEEPTIDPARDVASGPVRPAAAESSHASSEDLAQLIRSLEANMCNVVLGKPQVVRMCLVALLAGEHVLLEDVPGVGKTLVGKALAKSVSGDFCRLQFTPDLLPSDIVGSSVFHATSGEFVFNRGPIFANIVLADEINRAPPRTQSALLEAMSDGQASVDGTTYPLPQPFMVIATQNPFEFEGTYTLPESQLDRFLIRISMGYPAREDERRVLATHRAGEPVESLTPVLDGSQILQLQNLVRDIAVDDAISDYMLDIVDATRRCDELHIGVSTRGALSLYRASQSAALVDGRDYVVPDDVKELAVPVLVHRVIPKGFVQASQRRDTEQLILRLVEQIPVPD
jgi:MoxR-like ATPase